MDDFSSVVARQQVEKNNVVTELALAEPERFNLGNVKLLAWDLENSPMLSWHWGRWNQNIGLVQTVEESRVLCFGARWISGPNAGQYVFSSVYDHGRENMLKNIYSLIDEADGLVSWNGAGFDTKVINREFLLSGMTPPTSVKEVDMLRVARQKFKFSSNKLDAVAQQLGVGSKVSHSGFQLWLDVMAGDRDARLKFREYQKQDVDLLVKLFKIMLPWMPASMMPNINLYDDAAIDVEAVEYTDEWIRDVGACAKCGSRSFQFRGFTYTSTVAYRRISCNDCGSFTKFKSKVGKADMVAVN